VRTRISFGAVYGGPAGFVPGVNAGGSLTSFARRQNDSERDRRVRSGVYDRLKVIGPSDSRAGTPPVSTSLRVNFSIMGFVHSRRVSAAGVSDWLFDICAFSIIFPFHGSSISERQIPDTPSGQVWLGTSQAVAACAPVSASVLFTAVRLGSPACVNRGRDLCRTRPGHCGTWCFSAERANNCRRCFKPSYRPGCNGFLSQYGDLRALPFKP